MQFDMQFVYHNVTQMDPNYMDTNHSRLGRRDSLLAGALRRSQHWQWLGWWRDALLQTARGCWGHRVSLTKWLFPVVSQRLQWSCWQQLLTEAAAFQSWLGGLVSKRQGLSSAVWPLASAMIPSKRYIQVCRQWFVQLRAAVLSLACWNHVCSDARQIQQHQVFAAFQNKTFCIITCGGHRIIATCQAVLVSSHHLFLGRFGALQE